MDIAVKSVLAPPSLSDGLRVLVERRWPRAADREALQVDLWLPEAAFTPQLAAWMNGHPQHAAVLRKRYFLSLRTPEAEAALERLYRHAMRRRQVTLLHAGRRAENTAASILKSLMEGKRKPPSPTGPAKAAAAAGRARASRPRPRRR